ncbi:MAG: ATP-binding protein [Candidatus Sericytochromatia bacterium]|nr:ATP-binding protein [Candidatus Sericytochromatia bacterium]
MSPLRLPSGRPLRLWLFLLLLFAMLIPVGLSSMASIWQHRKELARIEASSLEQAMGMARLAERYLLFAMAQANQAVEARPVASLAKSSELARVVGEHPIVAAVDSYDPSGRFLASSWPGEVRTTPAEDEALARVLEQGKPAASPYFVSPRLQRPVVALVIPVRNDAGKLLVLCRLTLGLEFLLEEITHKNKASGRFYLFLVDQRGTLIAAQNFLPGRNLQNLKPVSLLLSGQTGTIKYVSTFFGDVVDGEERLGAYRHVGNTGWGIVVSHPSASIGTPVLRDLRTTLLTITLSGIISILLALGAGRWLLEPLENLARRMDQAASLPAFRSGITLDHAHGVTEYRQLERAYASLTDRIHAQFEQLAEANDRLGTLVRERTRALEEANTSLQERSVALSEANERLIGLVTELRRMDALQSDFLANVSHELRTPITFITAYGSSLEDGLLGPLTHAQAEAVAFMLEGASRLTSLVDDLLDLNRLESGVLALHIEALSPRPLVEGVVAAMRPIANRKTQRLVSAIAPDLPDLLGDPERLAQILRNLLSNAFKFTPEGLGITVRAYHDDNRGIIEVKDEGIGIPEAALPHLFERFYQVDASSTKAYSGAGIGLNIVRQLTEMMNGTVTIQSTEGVGTTVRISLPLAPVAQAAAIRSEPAVGAWIPFGGPVT